MKRDQYWAKPKEAKCEGGGEAWWYANKGSIEVHAASGMTHFTVRIPRKQILEYIKRTGK